MVYEEQQTVKCRYSRKPTVMSSVLQGAVEVTEERGGGGRETERERERERKREQRKERERARERER